MPSDKSRVKLSKVQSHDEYENKTNSKKIAFQSLFSWFTKAILGLSVFFEWWFKIDLVINNNNNYKIMEIKVFNYYFSDFLPIFQSQILK